MRGWRNKTARSFVFLLGLGLAPVCVSLATAALAGDWSLETKLSEKGDFNDNYRGRANSDGSVFGSISNLYFDLINRSYVHRFDLKGDLGYRTYVGRGSDEVPDRFLPKLETSFTQKSKTSEFDFAAYYAREDTTAVDVLDPDGLVKDITRNSMGTNFSLSRAYDVRNSLGVTASVQDVFYNDNDGSATPSFNTDMSVFWTHRLTKRTNFTTSAGVGWLLLDNPEDTERITYRLRGDLTSQISKNLRLKAGGGLRVIDSAEDIFLPLPGHRRNSTDVGWLADISLDYTMKTGSFSIFASRSVDPGTLGDLQERTTFGGAVIHRINDVSEVDLSAQYRITSASGFSDEHVFTVSPVYKRNLTDEWSFQTGYRFTLADANEGKWHSNNVYLTFSRAMLLVP
jgi:hypothetical protein